MATKAKAPSYAHKQTRLNLDSATPGTSVLIRIPAQGDTRKIPTHRIAEQPPAQDESTFKIRYLATAGSVYHRKYHSSPRSFLWRILEDNKVLAIQAVDLCKKENVQDANITLNIFFPGPFRPACVTFAESKDHDVLIVYVLSVSGHLYVLSLRPDFFRRPSSTEDNLADWCKIHLSSGLAFKTAHRLVALQEGELLAALSDGGLLRLEKQHGDEDWRESHYNERNFFTSSFSFRNTNTHRVGNVNFDRTSAVSLTSNPIRIHGGSYIFTVCMDHQLRVWNLSSGKLAYSGDIINQSKLASDLTKYTIDPTASQLVKVLQDFNGDFTVVTYSPMGLGQFKFWAVDAATDGSLHLADKFPENVFELRAPSSDQWTLLDFSVMIGNSDEKTHLWILWKNNLSLRIHKVEIDLRGDQAELQAAWKDGWVSMAAETLDQDALPTILPSDPSDITDKWLNYILFPGKFSSITIETVLNIYENSLGRVKDASTKRSKRIPERICSLVASTATLTSSGGNPNYEQFRLATDMQWRRFYRLLVELEKLGGEALSLSVDNELGLPWIVTADGVSIIRNCSTLESVWHNPLDYRRSMPLVKHVASLINSAAVFRDGCSDVLLNNFETVLKAELAEDPLTTDHIRLRLFYERTNFAGQIGDEEYAQLLANLGGNFKAMNTSAYKELLNRMTNFPPPDKQESHPLTNFGKKAVVKGIQETIQLHRQVCFDQLMLLVFFESEVDQKEEDTNLDTAKVFQILLNVLSRLELLKWLASTQITIRHSRTNNRSELVRERSSPNSKKSSAEDSQTITVLEGCAFHLLGFDITSPDQNMPSKFTELLMQICDVKSAYELDPYLIQCFLLKHHRTDLALDFNRFCNKDPFSTYIQGRTYLAAGDLESAEMFFKRAAFGLSYIGKGEANGRVSTNSLLDDTEWNLLYAGMPNYYAHIVSLFDNKKHYTQVATFANLSLQFNPYPPNPSLATLRTEMLSRLFNAQTQTSHFAPAHATLALFTDSALRLASLRTLVAKMCETANSSLLISLPFLGLQEAVDEILHAKCATVPDVNIGVPYHKILYAWRIKRGNFRGAAAILLERLQRLKGSRDGDRRGEGGNNGFETQITRGYLMLINCLSCVDSKQAWILDEGPVGGRRGSSSATRDDRWGAGSLRGANGVGGPQKKEGKRKVVTLQDLRGELGWELDRLAAIENDQFGVVELDGDGDVMDIL